MIMASKDQAMNRGAIYARYSTKFQHSIDDQVRECKQFAAENGIVVDDSHIFFDEGVTGRSNRRQGLNDLIDALKEGTIDVILIYSTNRLYRKLYRAIQFVEEEVVERDKRCVFVTSGIDTADKTDWRQRLQMFGMMDEYVGTVNVRHIQAAHVGQFMKGMVFGSLPFGYTGEVVPGCTTKRGTEAQRIVLDPESSAWVQRIFRWYSEEGESISGIVRRLNAERAPLSPKAQSGRWTYHTVRRILNNERYTGRWSYGDRENRWLNRQGYARQFKREKPIHSIENEAWRIIDDATWSKAQARLADNRREGGRKPKSTSPNQNPPLLNGLLFCKGHQRPLTTTGTQARYMMCPVCKAQSKPALYSLLDRRLATDLILDCITKALADDKQLAEAAMTICQDCINARGRPEPSEIERLRKQMQKLSERVKYILSMPADTEVDQAENRAQVQELRAQRAKVQSEIAELEELARRPAVVPSTEALRKSLKALREVLHRAVQSPDHANLRAARELVFKLTGGRIEVEQCGERKAQRGWLRATFSLYVIKPLLDEYGGYGHRSPVQAISIDIKAPTLAEQRAPRVRELYEQGLSNRTIAETLGINRNSVHKALKTSFAAEGKPLPDSRERRLALSEEQRPKTKAEQLADQAMVLYEQGLPINEIAGQLGVDRDSVTAGVRIAHQRRGLEMPDGRARRKQRGLDQLSALTAQAIELYNAGWFIKDIAGRLSIGRAKLSYAITCWQRENGLPVPDNRSRSQRLRFG